MKQKYDDLVALLPPEWPVDLIPEIRRLSGEDPATLVVLDDDPTGTQTVYDIPVLTEWSAEAIAEELARGAPLFYILTNSRRLPEKEAVALALTIGANLRLASVRTSRKFRVVSRSDSTLRGHFPAEVDSLASSLGLENALRIIMPFFYEGGRFTINDVHYVQEQEYLVPASETSFAKDATFGYTSSNLTHWVEEKTKGAVNAAEVQSISLDDIRKGGPEQVLEKILSMKTGSCVVNALARRDAEVVALALLKAEQQGISFICRTAASIVPPLAGLYPKPLLQPQDLALPSHGGSLTIIGSYQPRSGAQLDHFLSHAQPQAYELEVPKVLNGELDGQALQSIANSISLQLRQEKNVVLFTSRELVTGDTPDSSLEIVAKVSACLSTIVQRISQRPRFIIAKGGITSSDIATESLGVKKALVLGQILPGVPVWQLGADSKFPGLSYIVFPGNVGEVEAITRVVGMLE